MRSFHLLYNIDIYWSSPYILEHRPFQVYIHYRHLRFCMALIYTTKNVFAWKQHGICMPTPRLNGSDQKLPWSEPYVFVVEKWVTSPNGYSGEMLMTCTYTHPPRLRIIINSHDWYPNKLAETGRVRGEREIECVDNANSLTHGRQAIGCTHLFVSAREWNCRAQPASANNAGSMRTQRTLREKQTLQKQTHCQCRRNTICTIIACLIYYTIH